jgi:glycerophosphoryl diester phosphodiesterase
MPKSNYWDIQGHRGARGLYPENTITGFVETIKLGITTLELDVVISKDRKVVVSHEAWMNPLFCFTPDGLVIAENQEERYNLYHMNYGDILGYDCGKEGHPEFPLQVHVPERKPLLENVFLYVENLAEEKGVKVTYNIEIKSDPSTDGIFHPAPAEFVELIKNVILKKSSFDKCILQSFDKRILQEIKKQKIKVRTGLLIEDTGDPEAHLQHLGFLPDYYNPEFNLVTQYLVDSLHARDIKIVPWTVNEVSDMEKLIALGVDGLITDYPDRALTLISERV